MKHSTIKGRVGSFDIEWITIPKGSTGFARVRTKKITETEFGPEQEIRWRRDPDGIWIEWENRIRGFDFDGTKTEAGSLEYKIARRGSDEVWAGAQFLHSGEELTVSDSLTKKRKVKVRAQMPGKIVRVFVKVGDAVVKDQPLLVMEAMKMENEIRALTSGTIKEVKVQENQNVESGADLLILD